ncbi:hypothetical protein [Mangrovibrevibacter kandeliae]|uniref:hypothetical protein n=1 Tax=Mangrovibrevibacter kandeliae TaxID=2968473 RepID=UPI0021194278|nr:hypothetical protein [Aurantimonas sp. CSK15Z-1]MCQ8781697.1 hypothetical protein [Aurantimonas sp. CSK15Z-1]
MLPLFRVHVEIDGQRTVIEKATSTPEEARQAVAAEHQGKTLRFGPTKMGRQKVGKRRRRRAGR